MAVLHARAEASGGVLGAADLVAAAAHSVTLQRALERRLVFPAFEDFTTELRAVFDDVRGDTSGAVASYIPQLARVDAEQFGIAACTVDGQQFTHGDARTQFCIQSCSKVLTYALALEQHGEDKVHRHVGREPSGRGFNERVLNADGLPHNPYINSGAIMSASLVQPASAIGDRFDHVFDAWVRATGGRAGDLGFANSTYLSELASADRNFCLAYMMREEGVFPDGTDLATTVQLYFMLCSITATCEAISVFAATLANGGVCPTTGARVLSESTVRNCLSLMATCGMYDQSGEFMVEIGCPAKSGVGGGIITAVPGVGGICSWSPRLDKVGNSARGVAFFEQLCSVYSFHIYDASQRSLKLQATARAGADQDDRTERLLRAAAGDDVAEVRRLVSAENVDVNVADYDARTALHVAAANDATRTVRLLLELGADAQRVDRWGAKPAVPSS
mmetsp:Transcript_27837/g.67597  ORF Transcript_27837/g.67597 Transcript_27837/m.67597 type:complete len:449 (+) Transcript_27837:389-1735(+)